MSERQEEYVINQARDIVEREQAKEQLRMEREIIRYQINKAIAKADKIMSDATREAPIRAFLMTRCGAIWAKAHIDEYRFPGEIRVWVAMMAVGMRNDKEKIMVLSEVIYQLGDEYRLLAKEGKD